MSGRKTHPPAAGNSGGVGILDVALLPCETERVDDLGERGSNLR